MLSLSHQTWTTLLIFFGAVSGLTQHEPPRQATVGHVSLNFQPGHLPSCPAVWPLGTGPHTLELCEAPVQLGGTRHLFGTPQMSSLPSSW